MFRLDNMVAVVTGASRGIGRAIAKVLGAAGAVVIGTATTSDGAATIDDFLKANAILGKGMVLNVTDPSTIEIFINNIIAEYQHIDILVNNAGITADTLILRMKDEDWQKVIDTNLTGCFRLMRAVLKPMLKEKFGRIINIGSVVGTSGNPGQANYCAAKAGLIGLTKAVAREIAVKGITVNAIAPGFIATEMIDTVQKSVHEHLLNNIPMRRMGDVTEIASGALFLASKEAGYITGETLHINGGLLMV